MSGVDDDGDYEFDFSNPASPIGSPANKNAAAAAAKKRDGGASGIAEAGMEGGDTKTSSLLPPITPRRKEGDDAKASTETKPPEPKGSSQTSLAASPDIVSPKGGSSSSSSSSSSSPSATLLSPTQNEAIVRAKSTRIELKSVESSAPSSLSSASSSSSSPSSSASASAFASSSKGSDKSNGKIKNDSLSPKTSMLMVNIDSSSNTHHHHPNSASPWTSKGGSAATSPSGGVSLSRTHAAHRQNLNSSLKSSNKSEGKSSSAAHGIDTDGAIEEDHHREYKANISQLLKKKVVLKNDRGSRKTKEDDDPFAALEKKREAAGAVATEFEKKFVAMAKKRYAALKNSYMGLQREHEHVKNQLEAALLDVTVAQKRAASVKSITSETGTKGLVDLKKANQLLSIKQNEIDRLKSMVSLSGAERNAGLDYKVAQQSVTIEKLKDEVRMLQLHARKRDKDEAKAELATPRKASAYRISELESALRFHQEISERLKEREENQTKIIRELTEKINRMNDVVKTQRLVIGEKSAKIEAIQIDSRRLHQNLAEYGYMPAMPKNDGLLTSEERPLEEKRVTSPVEYKYSIGAGNVFAKVPVSPTKGKGGKGIGKANGKSVPKHQSDEDGGYSDDDVDGTANGGEGHDNGIEEEDYSRDAITGDEVVDEDEDLRRSHRNSPPKKAAGTGSSMGQKLNAFKVKLRGKSGDGKMVRSSSKNQLGGSNKANGASHNKKGAAVPATGGGNALRRHLVGANNSDGRLVLKAAPAGILKNKHEVHFLGGTSEDDAGGAHGGGGDASHSSNGCGGDDDSSSSGKAVGLEDGTESTRWKKKSVGFSEDFEVIPT